MNNDKYGWSSLYNDNVIFSDDNDDKVNSNRMITFAIVSYSDSNILDYSTYSYAINTIWSEANGYKFRLYKPNDDVVYDKYDSRWNKVIIIYDALNEWAQQYDYIVWMDSDLIIMDLEMRLEYIVYQHKKADVIFSKDPRIENGVVNTGMFIIKNTVWSKKFIYDWWYKYDRSQGMDQHIFDKLWYENVNDIKDHVVLLPFDHINSHFPAWINQKEYNNVLHLAGANNQFRKQSFKLGLDEICHAYRQCTLTEETSKCPIKPQLGLNRLVLHELYNSSSTSITIMNILKEGKMINIQSYFVNETVLNLIIDIKGRLANQRQNGYNSDIGTISYFDNASNVSDATNISSDGNRTCELLDAFMNDVSFGSYEYDQKTMTLYSLRWVYCSLYKLLHVTIPGINQLDKETTSTLSTSMVKSILLQNLLDASYDLLVHNTDHNENYFILMTISPYVEIFVNIIPSDSKHIALYYKVKHREFTSNCCRDLHDKQCQLQYLFETYEVWKELDAIHWYGAGNGMSNPYKEYSETLAGLATLLCSNNRAEEGLIYAQESLRLTNSIWADGNTIEKVIPDTIFLSLIGRYIIAAECAKRCENTKSQVVEYKNDAINVLERFRNSSSNLYSNEFIVFQELIDSLNHPVESFDSNCTTNKNKKWLKKKK